MKLFESEFAEKFSEQDIEALKRLSLFADHAATLVTMFHDPAIGHCSEEMEVALTELSHLYYDVDSGCAIEDDLSWFQAWLFRATADVSALGRQEQQ